MAVDISVSCCCWLAVDGEMVTSSLVQLTVVAGPSEEMQVKVLDAKSCIMSDMTIGRPVYGMISCSLEKDNEKEIYLVLLHKYQQTG